MSTIKESAGEGGRRSLKKEKEKKMGSGTKKEEQREGGE